MINDNLLKLTNTVYKLLEFFPEAEPLKNKAKEKVLTIMDGLVLVNENSGWTSFQNEKIKVQLLDDIDIFLGYLTIGKAQGWLNSSNCLIVVNEYEKIRKSVAPIMPLAKIEIPSFQVIPANVGPQMFDAERPQAVLAGIQTEPKESFNSVADDTEVSKMTSTSISDLPVIPAQKEQVIQPKLSDRQKRIVEYLNQNEKAQVMDLLKVLPSITKRTIRRDLDELLKLEVVARFGEFNQVFYKIKK